MASTDMPTDMPTDVATDMATDMGMWRPAFAEEAASSPMLAALCRCFRAASSVRLNAGNAGVEPLGPCASRSNGWAGDAAEKRREDRSRIDQGGSPRRVDDPRLGPG